NLPAGDRVRILLFSTDLNWVSREAASVDSARERLHQSIDGAFAGGQTKLYDAIADACTPSTSDPKGAIRAVVVLTDGEDTSSKNTLEALLQKFRTEQEGEETSRPRVFTIAYGKDAKPEILKKIAETAGGAFFTGTPKDITKVYAELDSFF